MPDPSATARARSEYNAYASRYDRETRLYEWIMLDDGRAWACMQARGLTLEIAIGTGRNLPFYSVDTRLVGLDLSRGMLALARRRAHRLHQPPVLIEGDAQSLPFADGAFDTVICTLGLSSIPDDQAAIGEIYRVLRSCGRVVIVGHVASPHRPVRALQHVIERLAATRATDSQSRRVTPLLHHFGFAIEHHQRSRVGIIERLIAIKPTA